MSIILDALRKSEAARRRAEAPDLFTTLPPPLAPDARAHRTRGAWRAGTAVAVIAVIALAWWWLQRTPEVMPGAPAAVDAVPGAAPAPVLPPPVATDTPAAPPGMPPPVATTAPAPTAPAPVATPPTETIVDVPPKSRPLPATPVAPPAPPVETTVAATPPPTASSGDPIPVARLDAGTRKQLPPLRVSMHLYDADPARRFIILDDKRLGEGDLAGEIVVERIDRDGAVLAWRGTRLRIAPP